MKQSPERTGPEAAAVVAADMVGDAVVVAAAVAVVAAEAAVAVVEDTKNCHVTSMGLGLKLND
jgi:hypothetical protein